MAERNSLEYSNYNTHFTNRSTAHCMFADALTSKCSATILAADLSCLDRYCDDPHLSCGISR